MADNVLAQVPRKRYPTLDEQMRSDIVNYLSRLKSDFVTSGERAGQGLGQVIDDGNYLEGVPRVVLGGLGALSAPVSAAVSPVLGPLLQPVGEAVDTYVGQPIEQATGYPADITNELFLTGVTAGAAPVLRPALRGSGNFLAKVGDAAEAGLNRAGYTARPQAGTFFSGVPLSKLDEAAQAADDGIIAYHGSPHSFDKFSMDKIGTGEGAQAYGHGLYFAEKEKVARGYRNALQDTIVIKDGAQIHSASAGQNRQVASGYTPQQTWVLNELASKFKPGGDSAALLDEFMSDAQQQLAQHNSMPDHFLKNNLIKDAKERIDILSGFKKDGVQFANDGSMYQVRLKVRPDELLDWDKPYTKQSQFLRNAIKDLPHFGGPLTSGRDVYRRIGNSDMAAATEKLKDAGVKGIRYKDALSRGVKGGTYNYVIFDDSLIDILKKYGIPMTAGAGGAMLVSGEAVPPELAAQLQGGT